jgi:hypothetical protein
MSCDCHFKRTFFLTIAIRDFYSFLLAGFIDSYRYCNGLPLLLFAHIFAALTV